MQDMSKTVTFRPSLIVRLLFAILLAFLVLILGTFFLLFYVPVVTWVLWRDADRVAELEKKMAAYDKMYGKPGSS